MTNHILNESLMARIEENVILHQQINSQIELKKPFIYISDDFPVPYITVDWQYMGYKDALRLIEGALSNLKAYAERYPEVLENDQ